jgi:hypothetical protein
VDQAAVEAGYWLYQLTVAGENDQRIEVLVYIDVSTGAALDIVPNAIDSQFRTGGWDSQVAQIVSFVAPTTTAVELSADQPWVSPRVTSGPTPTLRPRRFQLQPTPPATLPARSPPGKF